MIKVRVKWLQLAMFAVSSAAIILALQVSSLPQPVSTTVPLLSYVRAGIWLIFLTVVPGVCILYLTNIAHLFSLPGLLAISISISLFVDSAAASFFTFVLRRPEVLPLALGLCFMFLSVLLLFRQHRARDTKSVFSDKGTWLVILATVIAFSLSLQIAVGYLVGGDMWRMVSLALFSIETKDVTKFVDFYPTFLPMMIVALSECTGLPVVNAFALSVIPNSFGPIAFYAMVSKLFRKPRTWIISTILYSFGGGFGWIAFLLWSGRIDFFTISYRTQDLYFAHQLTVSLLPSALAFALFFSWSSLYTILSYSSGKSHDKIALAGVSGVCAAAAFLSHLMEVPILVIPTAIIMTKWAKPKRKFHLPFFLAFFLVFVVAFDSLDKGFNIIAVWQRTDLLYAGLVKIAEILARPLLLLVIVFVLAIFVVMRKRYILPLHRKSDSPRDKHKVNFLSVFLLFVWLFLLMLWLTVTPPPLIYDVNSFFPPYFYPVKFGSIGLFALVGMRRILLEKGKFYSIILCLAWSLLISLIWWGYETISYFYPFLAIVAAWGIVSSSTSILKIPHRSVRVFSATLIILGFASSLFSYPLTYGFFVGTKSVPDGVAQATIWAYQNTKPSDVVFVPEDPFYDFVLNIGHRKTIPSSNDPDSFAIRERLVNSDSPPEIVTLLRETNTSYALFSKNIHFRSRYLEHLLNTSYLGLEDGDVKIVKLPKFNDVTDARIIVSEPVSLVQEEIYFKVLDSIFVQEQNSTMRTTWKKEIGSLFATANTSDLHFFQFYFEMPIHMDANVLMIRYSMNDTSLYTISLALMTQDSKLLDIYYLDRVYREVSNPEVPFDTFYFPNASAIFNAEKVELALWTTSTNTYSVFVEFIAFLSVDTF